MYLPAGKVQQITEKSEIALSQIAHPFHSENTTLDMLDMLCPRTFLHPINVYALIQKNTFQEQVSDNV